MRVKRHKGTKTQGDTHTKKPTANRPTAVILLVVFYVYGNIHGRALSVFEKISALFFCVCVSHCCCTYRRRSQIQLCAFPCDAFYFLVNKFKKKKHLSFERPDHDKSVGPFRRRNETTLRLNATATTPKSQLRHSRR